MAFRRPGIQILERDEFGEPTVVAGVPFDERVIEQDGELIFLRDKDPTAVPSEDGTSFVTVREPTLNGGGDGLIRTADIQDVNRDGIDDRDQVGGGEPAGGVEFVDGIIEEGFGIQPPVDVGPPPIEPAPDDGFPVGERLPASETMAEKDAVSDGANGLPNALPAGVGEGGAGGQAGNVSVNVEGSPQATTARTAGAAVGGIGIAIAVAALVVFGFIFDRVRRGR